jgi:hypothetical protein
LCVYPAFSRRQTACMHLPLLRLYLLLILTCMSLCPFSPGEHTAPDPELERKLREMEANQLNAWEEKEKLSQALEAERQANMNNVISEMMNSVKEQKVQHMKNIKRLTNEKALLTSQFKESKEANVKLKSNLDVNIQKYQVRTFDV